jgi:cytochrome c biogenesis protein
MAVSTAGIEVRTRSRALREGIELLSSMRFSISLLSVICIASVIGTVVKQNEPANNYVNQFGPFWADVFSKVNLYTVYSAPWFLLILGFLVVSTSLCIARNAPKIFAELRQFKEHLRVPALAAFHHKAEAELAGRTREAEVARVTAWLAAAGWKSKVQVRDGGTMVAAKKGSSNKLGYLAAHSAIVLVCIGGLLDGDLVVRAQMAWQDKTPFTGGGQIDAVPAEHRLGLGNPTFRGNVFVPEGQRAGVAVLSMPGGVVLQDLPFDIELKRFIVEYHATGMPKLFASEIVVHDRRDGSATPHRVEVNKPAVHDGIAIYQSSFDDGGSRVKLTGWPLAGGAGITVEGRIGEATELVGETARGEQTMRLEYTALRVINVENFGTAPVESGADVRRVDLVGSIEQRLGSGAKVLNKTELRNVGPSITYKLRDASGQAREFHNYMAPVLIEDQPLFFAGVRENPQDNFRYLRIPADEQQSLEGWMRLRQALMDPAMREQAARRYVALAMPGAAGEAAEQLLATTRRVLGLFAGAEAGRGPAGDTAAPGGLQAVADFLEGSVPEAERPRISEVLLRILNGSLFELHNAARERAGLAAMPLGPEAERFMTQALMSLSDSFHYPAPMLFSLADFTQVQASVFQVARAPGRNIVYLGCVLLIVGVFAMLYVRERRLWVWIEDSPAAGGAPAVRARAALSTTRRTLEADAEFDRLRAALLEPPR